MMMKDKCSVYDPRRFYEVAATFDNTFCSIYGDDCSRAAATIASAMISSNAAFCRRARASGCALRRQQRPIREASNAAPAVADPGQGPVDVAHRPHGPTARPGVPARRLPEKRVTHRGGVPRQLVQQAHSVRYRQDARAANHLRGRGANSWRWPANERSIPLQFVTAASYAPPCARVSSWRRTGGRRALRRCPARAR